MVTYDAVVVLSGGIRKTAEGFAPATYADSDGFGMMGGHLRPLAASLLYAQQVTDTFIFTTGITAKTAAALGANVPSEAAVYSQEFLSLIAGSDHPAPTIILEDRSTNTIGNVQEFFAIIDANGWKRVAVLSSEYHLARIKGLCALVGQNARVHFTFLSAEKTLKRARPGKYDAEIDAAYASKEGKKRLQNEAIGVAAIAKGGYTPAEFQLGKQ